MAVEAGTRLGPYEVISAIGAGGMGEVYRGRDTRLDRTVAIKVLSSHLSDNPDLKQRFEREARAISSLQHPNICVLHDVGNDAGTDYLVMEFLVGESLADRLKRGPLPLNQFWKIAVEVADALDKAHRAGITHRDLKPGNIMLTKSGSKLLDFGLAKVSAAAFAASAGNPPSPSAFALTLSSPASPLTSAGAIVGTVQYMAPEQIEGKEADARSDIFAFGLVLYEMLSGIRAFEGKTQASIVASILALEPKPLRSVKADVPAPLARVVNHCLEKDPELRFQSAHDLKLHLQAIAEIPATATEAAPVSARPARFGLLPWLLVGALALCLVGTLVVRLRQPAALAPEPTRFDVDLGGLSFTGTLAGSRVAISPDGRKTVLMLTKGGSGDTKLYLRSMDNVEVLPVPGTEGGTQPFFSPDSRWLGFSAGGKLKKVPLEGGVPVTLCEPSTNSPNRGGVSATWTDDGTILFIAGGTLYRISDGGGTPEKIAEPDESKGEHFSWVEALPGSRGVLLVVPGLNTFDIDVLTLETRKRQRIIEGGSWPRYLATGHILYSQFATSGGSSGFTGGLLVVPFDLKKLARTGSPVPVLEGVFTASGGAGFYDVSADGILVYNPGVPIHGSRHLAWLDNKGKIELLPAAPQEYRSPALSPDATRAAVTVTSNTQDIHLYDLKRGTLQRLTFEGKNDDPVFTPDGKRVIFGASVGRIRANLWWKPADGSGKAERLTTADLDQTPDSVSPDGKLLMFSQFTNASGSDLYVLPLQGDRNPQVFLQTPFSEKLGRFSPDGKWIAYVSNESGRSEVYVVSYPGAGDKSAISTEGGTNPRWSRDGRQLYYQTGNKLVAVDITVRPVFHAGTPRVMGDAVRISPVFTGRSFDVAPDGRILIVELAESSRDESSRLRVVENFATVVRQRLPAAR